MRFVDSIDAGCFVTPSAGLEFSVELLGYQLFVDAFFHSHSVASATDISHEHPGLRC